MIKINEIKKIVNNYSDVRIGVLGSHSALEIMDGAKDEELSTVVYCQKDAKNHTKDLEELLMKLLFLKNSKTLFLHKIKKSLEIQIQ